jgi:hypothetical protein
MLLILTGKRIYPRISVRYGHGFVPVAGNRYGFGYVMKVVGTGIQGCYPQIIYLLPSLPPREEMTGAPVVFEAVRINKKRPNLTIKFNI